MMPAPAYLLHENATVLCLDGGQATPMATNQRVKVSGHKIVTRPIIYEIRFCKLPPSSGGPCATAQWTSAAKRVKASGIPVLFKDSQAKCVPTGKGVKIVSTQTRVKAT